MANENTNQGKLKVVHNVKATPEKPVIDSQGQAQLFEFEQALVPEGFEDFAVYMNNRLSRTENKLSDTMGKLDKSTEQNQRLANSLEKVIPKFIDQSINQSEADLKFGFLAEDEQADVALIDGATAPAELLYPYTATRISKVIGNKNMTHMRVAKLIRDFKLFGDPLFHATIESTEHGKNEKYKPSIIREIYKRLKNPQQYGIEVTVAAKYSNFIRPTEAL